MSIVCLLLFFGCKKDKDDPKAQIVRKWKIENVTFKSYIDDKEITSETSIDNGSEGEYFEFTADNKLNINSKNWIRADDYTLNEDDKTLIIEDITYIITELTKSKLVFKESETEIVNGQTVR